VVQVNEGREIVEYLIQKLGTKRSLYLLYIMIRDKKVYKIRKYKELLESNKIKPNDGYVYIDNIQDIEYFAPTYFCPFLGDMDLLPSAYLSKLSYNAPGIVPAPGLKYVVVLVRFTNHDHVIAELADIDTVANNTNLSTIIRNVLGNETKYITNRKLDNIISQLNSQKILGGYDFDQAWDILYKYERGDTSLGKDVELIRDDYKRIFKPIRVLYNLQTKQLINEDQPQEEWPNGKV